MSAHSPENDPHAQSPEAEDSPEQEAAVQDAVPEESAPDAAAPETESAAPGMPAAETDEAPDESAAQAAPETESAAPGMPAAEADEAPDEAEVEAAPEVRRVEGSQWFILQTYSGFENRVKKTIEEKLRVASLEHQVEEIFVPGEDVTRVKNGRKRTQHVIYFPGYVLIKMNLTDELWHLLMDIPRVAGFVGGNNREPQPLGEEELSHIRSQMSEGYRQATLKDEFEVGQQVVVIDGPFANFSGKIDEVNVEKSKLRVLISILGRSTPVELDFDKVKPHTEGG